MTAFTINPALADPARFAAARAVLAAAVGLCAARMAARVGVPGWVAVAEGAPDTYDGVVAEVRAAMGGGRAVRVYAGASERTIYWRPEVNHAFRAWHDLTHAWHGFDFTTEGEIATARAQIAYMGDVTGIDRGDAVRLLYADTIGQVEYFARHGAFVPDQVAFVQRYASGLDARPDSCQAWN